jgi:hypothetical protein
MRLVKCGQLAAFGQECSNFINLDLPSFLVRNATLLNFTRFPGKQ